MKKIKISLLIMMLFILVGCGNQEFFGELNPSNYTFDKAIIKMPDESVLEIDIKTWHDFDGEQIQIESTDGKKYLTSSYNCIMIKEESGNVE
jgi:uncharacterized lipoprotein NlpE involved in copper resistance